MWLGKLTTLDMTLMGWLGCKTATQTSKIVSDCLRVMNTLSGSHSIKIVFLAEKGSTLKGKNLLSRGKGSITLRVMFLGRFLFSNFAFLENFHSRFLRT